MKLEEILSPREIEKGPRNVDKWRISSEESLRLTLTQLHLNLESHYCLSAPDVLTPLDLSIIVIFEKKNFLWTPKYQRICRPLYMVIQEPF